MNPKTMVEAITAYIGLGSNLGDRQQQIKAALEKLGEIKQTEVVRVSKVIETAALAADNQPKYLNTVAEIKTTLSAEDLYKKTADIENSLGRVRQTKWAPRTIDLDLLLYGEKTINRTNLTVPHPQMHLRSFVLKGLCELNQGLMHPVLKESMEKLAARLNGADFAINNDWPQLVSIAGIIGVGKTTLTEKLSKLLGCKTVFEAYDTNPFMPEVYAGKNEMALDSQLYFLTSRVTQLNHDTLAAGQIVITDYVFDKELIYARGLLNAEQLALYESVHKQIVSDVAAPVLIIYLTDSVKNCLERIYKRNRPYERKIEPQFLETLDNSYKKLFMGWKKCPVIRLSMPEFDYMQDSNIQHLANQIKYYVAT